MIYEYKHFAKSKVIILIVPVILIRYGIKYLLWIFNNDYANKTSAFFWGSILCLAGMFILIACLLKFYNVICIHRLIRKDTVKIIDGPIDNFVCGYLDKFEKDRFEVDGIYFEVGGFLDPGLQKTKAMNGPISGEENYLIIHYVDFKEKKFIIKICTENRDGELNEHRNNLSSRI